MNQRISYPIVGAGAISAIFVVFAVFTTVLTLQNPPTALTVEHKKKIAFPAVFICPQGEAALFDSVVGRCSVAFKGDTAAKDCPVATLASGLNSSASCYAFNFGKSPLFATAVHDTLTIALPVNISHLSESSSLLGKVAILYGGKHGVENSDLEDRDWMYPHVDIDSENLYTVNLQAYEDPRGVKYLKHGIVPARYNHKSPEFRMVVRFESMTQIEDEPLYGLAVLHLIGSLGGTAAIVICLMGVVTFIAKRFETRNSTGLCINDETTALQPQKRCPFQYYTTK